MWAECGARHLAAQPARGLVPVCKRIAQTGEVHLLADGVANACATDVVNIAGACATDVINMAVDDSRTDFAAVERIRRCMLINTRQYKNTLPTKYLIERFIQESKQETCWKELSNRSQEPCKNCTQ